MSSVTMSSGNFGNIIRDQANRNPAGLSGFKMPLNPSSSFSGSSGGNNRASHGQRLSTHQRTGSASSAWNRQSMNGALGFGSGNPPSLGAQRLPTHSEASSGGPSRSTSSSGSKDDPIVVVDASAQLKSTTSSLGQPGGAPKPRRESVSADKALREVQKALQSVETQG